MQLQIGDCYRFAIPNCNNANRGNLVIGLIQQAEALIIDQFRPLHKEMSDLRVSRCRSEVATPGS